MWKMNLISIFIAIESRLQISFSIRFFSLPLKKVSGFIKKHDKGIQSCEYEISNKDHYFCNPYCVIGGRAHYYINIGGYRKQCI